MRRTILMVDDEKSVLDMRSASYNALARKRLYSIYAAGKIIAYV